MKRFALATSALLTVAVAAPAFANDQLAASLGVDSGAYTSSQLIELKAAYDEDNAARINAILKSGNTDATPSTKGFGTTPAQLADSLGVDASKYSLAELVALKAALAEDDAPRVNAILSQAGQSSVNNPEVWLQFGNSVGLDAKTHTPSELVKAHKS